MLSQRLIAFSRAARPAFRPVPKCTRPFQRAPAPYARRALSSSTARYAQDDNPLSFSDAHFGPQSSQNAVGDAGSSSRSEGAAAAPGSEPTEHAVISTFDLFSIGVGPSSSHTVGPMRAGRIFVTDLRDAGLLSRVSRLKIALYGSLAATGKGHMTPQALLLGLEGADCETVETDTIPARFRAICETGRLGLGGEEGKVVKFDFKKDLDWMWGQTLPLHSNGMRLSVFDEGGDLVATNDYYSVGGGFVVNGALATSSSTPSSPSPTTSSAGAEQTTSDPHPADLSENIFYKQIRRADAQPDRRAGAEVPRATLADALGLHGPVLGVSGSAAGLLPESFDGGLDAPSRSSGAVEGSRRAARIPPTESAPREEKQEVSAAPAPPLPFHDAASLLALTRKHNLTIAQVVYNNELHWRSHDQVREQIFRIFDVMDNCIRQGVDPSNDPVLPGSLRLKRRAPGLYSRLMRGFYPNLSAPSSPSISMNTPSLGTSSSGGDLRVPSASTSGTPALGASSNTPSRAPRVRGSFDHPIMPVPPRRTVFPAMDFLSTYAIAVNEVNAAGGRVVTSPTNGAAGVIPAVLKYTLEFISEDRERDVQTFLLTASAIGMLFKRGATISAAEGGCMAEVGVACAMAAGGFAACMGASPEVIEQAAEIGIEHNLGLTCDPIDGLVQAPCIERNALGAVKAVTAAQLALASGDGVHAVSLDEAIAAMRVTAADMHTKYKETSLSGLATSVRIPVAVPDC